MSWAASQHWALKQLTPPACEPLDLVEAKAHMRVEIATDDDLIRRKLSAARRYAERLTQRQLVCSTWLLARDFFAPIHRLLAAIFGDVIHVPRPPLLDVVSIVYTDTTGAQQTLPAANYQVDNVAEPARIRPAFGLYWPVVRYQMNAVQVTYRAGYATPFVVTNPGTGTLAPVGSSRLPANDEVYRLQNSGGALPTPLAANTDYYVVNSGAGTFQLSLTQGGAAVTLTDSGTGLNFLGEIPEYLKTGILALTSYWYQNREINEDAVPTWIDNLLLQEWDGHYC